jgi:manganese-dependent inorganic pyrophosphatase
MKRRTTLIAAALATLCSFAALAADPVLVVGHKNPDTDAITAAIAVAYLKSQQGVPAVAIAQGVPDPETKFVLEKFNLQAPPVQTSVAGRQVILVDHNNYPQAPDDLLKAELLGIVDHHNFGGIKTEKSIEAWILPVGCSATIITRMYDAAGVTIPKPIAGGMLSAILSDTAVFKSPTTTPEDRVAAARLAKLAGVEDMQALGIKLFEIKSEIASIPAMTLLKRDMKLFVMSGRKVAVGQLELMDLDTVSKMKPELLNAMDQFKKTEGYHSVFLMLTDIMKENTELLLVTDDPGVVKKALGVEPKGTSAWLPGVMSRKKQVIPPLEAAWN